MDCAIDWTNSETVWASGDEKKLKNTILRLAKKHPDEVQIKTRPEDNDGTIVATFPRSWVRISPPRKVHMTDEQKKVAADRLARARRSASSELTTQV